MHPALGVAIAYASGSIPAAWLAGRAAGVDLRAQGSGNLGATNVVRVLGLGVGLVVFAVDTLKGALPVALLPAVTTGTVPRSWIAVLYGAAAIAGHVRPVWLGFAKGGKGVATACGVFLALTPVPTLAALAVFLAAFGSTGIVSLGSLTAATALPVLVWAERGWSSPMLPVAIAIAAFVWWTHRRNISRLRAGQENRFSRMGSASALVGTLLAGIVAALGIAWLLVTGQGG